MEDHTVWGVMHNCKICTHFVKFIRMFLNALGSCAQWELFTRLWCLSSLLQCSQGIAYFGYSACINWQCLYKRTLLWLWEPQKCNLLRLFSTWEAGLRAVQGRYTSLSLFWGTLYMQLNAQLLKTISVITMNLRVGLLDKTKCNFILYIVFCEVPKTTNANNTGISRNFPIWKMTKCQPRWSTERTFPKSPHQTCIL